ncbi:T-lymphoma invasion and metastasis-inducing protein 1-like [Scleropages formosus]|uniref:T-lymphoma invasion and metastasis-inducing protein 1-like n=1 Tax=Scleropages formosus TaxID=113540 RepID=A0A0P7XQ20_SCLFO|nr:T-lymphoma invasion and metastasis-inducing protein 1-like [Scleropages formosus]
MSVLRRSRHSKRASDSLYQMLHLTSSPCRWASARNLVLLLTPLYLFLFQSTEQAAAFCRSLHDMSSLESSSSPSLDVAPPLPPTATPRQLSDADKLRKVIGELVETERTYVKDLNCLMERYLTPLQKESFLTQDELDVLFGNLPEMVEFQLEFLKTLEDGTRLVPDLETLETVVQFKKVLFSLGGSFLYYADRFKIYSAFCASHTKVPKVLVKAKTDPEFKAFLDARNPKQQHSSTLESYLIKPIQRVLKYPLLLRELHSLTDPDSEEHYHLDVAMKAMNKVASHINEMQKIHEEYGAVFDQLIAEQTGDKKEGASHRTSVFDEKDPFRFRHMISTDALQVRALTTADSESSAVIEIVHVRSESEGRPERTFHLCCSSPENKKDFLKVVHSILRDKQRRQLLKTESLPPNKQYVPFGGKRLCALKGARPSMNRAVSAPPRTLGRRKLVHKCITIDTDIVFDSNPIGDLPLRTQRARSPCQLTRPQAVAVSAGDTDRWVEEQFDLQGYVDREEDVKETDILSDDDEYCSSVKTSGLSAEPGPENLLGALSLGGELNSRQGINRVREDKDTQIPPGSCRSHKLTHLRKQSAVEGTGSQEVIWVRRNDAGGANTDIF